MVKEKDMTEYYRQAGKMIKWQLNYNIVNGVPEKFIDCPANEWPEAKENLTVQHLMNQHGFVLQDCIPVYNKVFDPELITKNLRPIPKDKPKEGFKCGDKFEICSSGDRLEIISNINGITLHYMNVGKSDIKTTIVHLEKSLALGVWKRI